MRLSECNSESHQTRPSLSRNGANESFRFPVRKRTLFARKKMGEKRRRWTQRDEPLVSIGTSALCTSPSVPWPRVYSTHGRSLPTWQYWLMGIACIPWYAPFDMRALVLHAASALWVDRRLCAKRPSVWRCHVLEFRRRWRRWKTSPVVVRYEESVALWSRCVGNRVNYEIDFVLLNHGRNGTFNSRYQHFIITLVTFLVGPQ